MSDRKGAMCVWEGGRLISIELPGSLAAFDFAGRVDRQAFGDVAQFGSVVTVSEPGSRGELERLLELLAVWGREWKVPLLELTWRGRRYELRPPLLGQVKLSSAEAGELLQIAVESGF
jgi:hypothetical protein